jgi:glycosyltransferase involved in cell wall biosynthesis
MTQQKIVVLSDCRMPTLPEGGHGLGRLAHSLATNLIVRGYEVELWAGVGSKFDGTLVTHQDEKTRAETSVLDLKTVYIDCSHFHLLSKQNPDYRIIDWILDGECEWTPPRAFVTTPHDQKYYPSAEILPVGIDVEAIPYYGNQRDQGYLSFAAKIHPTKGFEDALYAHQRQAYPVRFVGERYTDVPLPDWQAELCGTEFYDFVGKSVGLLCPVKNPKALGGGLIPLEASAMGVPSIVYDFASTSGHVEHCVSGFVVRDRDELVDAIGDLKYIEPLACRDWVKKYHGIDVMMDAVEEIINGA